MSDSMPDAADVISDPISEPGPAGRAGLGGWLDRHDPTRYATHRGIRAALAVSVALPLAMVVVGNSQFTLFAAFGSLALVIFVDFPGSRRTRAFSYLTTGFVGMVLIALGTLASGTGGLAVIVMAVVAFGVLFAGVLSAASAAASRALLLAFVLPVTVPAVAADIVPRLGGWALGMLIAIPLALFLWPPREHDDLRLGVSRSCRALAAALSLDGEGADVDGGPDSGGQGPRGVQVVLQAAGQAMTDLRRSFHASVSRPIGLAAGGRLLSRVIRDLDWLFVEVRGLAQNGRLTWATAPAVAPEILAASATVLTASSTALDRPSPANREELNARLDDLTATRRDALQRWLGQALDPGPQDDLPTIERLHSLAYATDLAGRHVAAALEADARSSLDKVLGRGSRLVVMTGSVPGTTRVARQHLSWQSVWLHNSLRGALGMALAVLLAQITDVSHGFWVALGAMSVLRSSAMNTGATALRALAGTVVGVVIGAIALLLLGTSPVAWVVLPLVMFLAGFANDAISFAAGQAAFSIAVLIMFSLLSPTGWEVGLVRLENVAIGAGAALVVGLLLWPRGAGGAIRRAIADAYRANARLLANAVARLEPEPEPEPGMADRPAPINADEALGATFRLDDALRQYLADRGTKTTEIEDLVAVCVTAERVRLTSEALRDLADHADLSTAALPAVPRQAPDETAETAETAATAETSTGDLEIDPDLDAGLDGDFRRRTDRQVHWLDALAQEVTDEVTGVPPVPPADAVAGVLARVHRDPAAAEALRTDPTAVWVAIHLDDIARHERRLLPRLESFVAPPNRAHPAATG